MSSDREVSPSRREETPHPETHMEHFDRRLTTEFFSRLDRILAECPIQIFSSSYMAHPWPYRLQHYSEASPGSFQSSPVRLLDSDISSPEVTNPEVLTRGRELDATYIIAKDYLPFDQYEEDDLTESGKVALDDLRENFSDNVAATTESIRQFSELYDPDVHPTPYIPLQYPYADHYREVREIVEATDLPARYSLGGLKDAGPKKQIQALLEFREVAGPDPLAHGLGWGLKPIWVKTIRENPGLLDSVDNSTPGQGVRNGKILDKNWQTRPYAHVTGTWASVVGGVAELLQLATISHRLTEFSDDDLPADQQTLGFY